MTASDGKSVTVKSFQRNYVPKNQFETPAAGDECIAVNLTLNNGSSSEWTLPLIEMSAVDSNGQKHGWPSVSCGTTEMIDGLVAGGHADATLYFEVPTGSPVYFTWIPNTFEGSAYQTDLR